MFRGFDAVGFVKVNSSEGRVVVVARGYNGGLINRVTWVLGVLRVWAMWGWEYWDCGFWAGY